LGWARTTTEEQETHILLGNLLENIDLEDELSWIML